MDHLKSTRTWYQPNTINKKWPIKPSEENPCFLRGPLKCMTEAKNVNVSYNFDLRSHVIKKARQCSRWCYMSSFEWKNIVWWKILLFWKTFAVCLKWLLFFEKILCFEYVIIFIFYFFYELLIGPQPIFLGPGYSSRTVNTFLIKGKTIYDRL